MRLQAIAIAATLVAVCTTSAGAQQVIDSIYANGGCNSRAGTSDFDSQLAKSNEEIRQAAASSYRISTGEETIVSWIAYNGRIKNVKVEKKSGNELQDLACIEAVYGSFFDSLGKRTLSFKGPTSESSALPSNTFRVHLIPVSVGKKIPGLAELVCSESNRRTLKAASLTDARRQIEKIYSDWSDYLASPENNNEERIKTEALRIEQRYKLGGV